MSCRQYRSNDLLVNVQVYNKTIFVLLNLSFMCMFCRSLFVLLSFFLLISVLSVLLRFNDSDYPCGILNLFLEHTPISFHVLYIYLLLELYVVHFKQSKYPASHAHLVYVLQIIPVDTIF